MPAATVAIVRARAAHILEDIARVVELAGLAVPPGETVQLVTSVRSPFPYPSANTTPWQLEGAIRELRARGAGAIRCAETSPVLAAYGVEVAPAGDGAAMVLPTLACDATYTLAGATLLAAGRRAFALMDGTTCGDGPGPRALRPVVKDVLLASADPVALDAIAATMAGFDAATIPHLRAAADAGQGIVRIADIAVVGDVALARQRWGFATGGRLLDRVGGRLRGPLADRVQRSYQDLRWPLRDRAMFDHWRDATAWGQLFDRYEALGVLGATSPSLAPR